MGTGTREATRARGREGWRDPGPVWIDAAAAVVFYWLLTFVGAAFAISVAGDVGGIAGFIGAAPAAAVAVGIVVWLRSRPSADYSPLGSGRLTLASVGLTRVSGKWLVAGVGVAVISWLISRGLTALYVSLTGDTSNPQAAFAEASLGPLPGFIALILAGGLVVPFGEELLFRGVVFGWLRRWGMLVAVPVSAVFFGLFHGVNVVLPAAIVLGVLAALLYEKSGSIWPPVVAHAVYNTASFALIRAFEGNFLL